MSVFFSRISNVRSTVSIMMRRSANAGFAGTKPFQSSISNGITFGTFNVSPGFSFSMSIPGFSFAFTPLRHEIVPPPIRAAIHTANALSFDCSEGLVGAGPTNFSSSGLIAVSRERLQNFREKRIDGACWRNAVRDFVSDERLAKKLAHPAVDFARPKLLCCSVRLKSGAAGFYRNRQRN